MKLLRQLSVSGKLALAFSTVLVLMALTASMSAWQGSKVNDKTTRLIEARMTGVRDSLLMAESATRMRTRDYRLSITPLSEQAQAIERLQKSKAEFDKFRQSYEVNIVEDRERALFNQAMSDWDVYLKVSDQGVVLARSGDMHKMQELVANDGVKAFDKATAALKELAAYNDSMGQADGREVHGLYQRGLMVSGILLLLAMLVSVALSIMISRAIVRPLREAVNTAQAVASGDLSQDILVQGRDEVSQLQQALGDMVQQLRGVVSEVRRGVDSVGTASSQIAQGNADLSQRTEEQAANVQQTAASMEELTSTITQNASTAQEASRLALRAADAASQGGEVVARVVQTMEGITSSSRRVNDIIGVIDGIAFQTNILALNAAVEAARAGDQGRGFAVVASEVRSLAQRSATAAKEIKQLIACSVEQVDNGASQVGEAGRAMQDIVHEVRRVSALINEISEASHQQAMGVAQVGDAIQQLDTVTQQNAALVEEAAAAADSMRQQASKLTEVVGVFRVTA
jgi:methyl-accepting chemotaxis protein